MTSARLHFSDKSTNFSHTNNKCSVSLTNVEGEMVQRKKSQNTLFNGLTREL